MARDFTSERANYLVGSEEEADFYYDSGMMLSDMRFNRAPSLIGRVLEFKDWDDYDQFALSIPDSQSDEILFVKSQEMYEKLYDAYRDSGDAAKASRIAISLIAALDKIIGTRDKKQAIQKEALSLSREAGDRYTTGMILMGMAHSATYGALDRNPLELLHEAQAEFRKGSNPQAEHHSYRMELTILDPGRDEGLYADLNRVQEIVAKCEQFYRSTEDYANLVDLYIQTYQLLLLYEKPNLIQTPLVSMLEVVKAHFPDSYENNYSEVEAIFEENGLTLTL